MPTQAVLSLPVRVLRGQGCEALADGHPRRPVPSRLDVLDRNPWILLPEGGFRFVEKASVFVAAARHFTERVGDDDGVEAVLCRCAAGSLSIGQE